MDQSIIVAGGGRVGRRTVAILDDYDHDVTVIEQESDRCEYLADAQLGVVINGDAAPPSILDQADPEGADAVVFPEAAGARSVVDELLGRRVRSLQAATGDFDVVELEVAPRSPVAGKRLREVELPRGSQVISDADRSTVVDAGTTLRPDRRYLVAVEPGVADEVRKLMVG